MNLSIPLGNLAISYLKMKKGSKHNPVQNHGLNPR